MNIIKISNYELIGLYGILLLTKLNSSFQDEVKQEIEAKSFFLDS